MANGAFTERELQYIAQLIKQNKKIDAIKFIRENTGLTLKEAKDFVDTFNTTDNFAQTNTDETVREKPPVKQTRDLSQEELAEAIRFIRNNQKINAIKFIQEKTNYDLKISKELADTIEFKINDALKKQPEQPPKTQEKNVQPPVNKNNITNNNPEPTYKPKAHNHFTDEDKKAHIPQKKSNKNGTLKQEIKQVILSKNSGNDLSYLKKHARKASKSTSGCMVIIVAFLSVAITVIGLITSV